MSRRRMIVAFLVVGFLASTVSYVPGSGASAAEPAAPVAEAPMAGEAAVAAPVAAQGINLRVGSVPATLFLGLYVARERGWFTEEGLAIDVEVMAGGAEILPAMIGGSLDVGVTNAFTHVLARDQGFDIKALAGAALEVRGEPTHAILVRADSPIQSAQDLQGRTMATNTLNNIDHLMQQIWLQRSGVDPRRVNIVEVPFPQMPPALAQGRVDAIGPTEPFVAVAQGQGARVVAYHYTDTNPSTLIAYLAATGDWLSRNRDAAWRFARAVQRANDYFASNRDEQRAAAVRFMNIDPNLAAALRFEQFVSRIDPEGIQWWIDAGRSFGLVNNALNAEDFLYETVR